MVNLIEPMDQTRDYDRAITMLDMTTADDIELTPEQFQCYVMDDWSWKHQFSASNSNYTRTKIV
jgi:hypothetical protein